MGTTVGNVLVSYDIDKSHSQVKTALENLGYLDYFTLTGSKRVYSLPNTTLWHPVKTSNLAMADLKKICEDLKVTLEKAVAVKAAEFVGI